MKTILFQQSNVKRVIRGMVVVLVNLSGIYCLLLHSFYLLSKFSTKYL